MLKNLNNYDLISNFFLFHEQQTCSSSAFKLDQFNLAELLSSGQRLLGTSTQKYEHKHAEEEQQQSAKQEEMIRQQRNTLYMKLGIDVAGAAKLDTRHIFSDEDLIAASAADHTAADDNNSNASSAASSATSKRKESESYCRSQVDVTNKKVKRFNQTNFSRNKIYIWFFG
jgi:hypothetical protein